MPDVRIGLEAWYRGDFDALESILDPDVELLWLRPGDWDCHGRDAVIGLLRERRAQGFAGGEVQIEEIDDHTILVASDPRRLGEQGRRKDSVTVITLREGKVTRMQQYPTRGKALAAINK